MLSKVETFFRHCPSCGRRFEIRLVSKEAVDVREETYEKYVPVAVRGAASIRSGYASSPLVVEEGVPTVVEVTDFNYTYRCKHCNHVWSEIHEGTQAKGRADLEKSESQPRL